MERDPFYVRDCWIKMERDSKIWWIRTGIWEDSSPGLMDMDLGCKSRKAISRRKGLWCCRRPVLQLIMISKHPFCMNMSRNGTIRVRAHTKVKGLLIRIVRSTMVGWRLRRVTSCGFKEPRLQFEIDPMAWGWQIETWLVCLKSHLER